MLALTCLACQGAEFEVDLIYSRSNFDSYWGSYEHESVIIGTHRHAKEIYAHECKDCGYIMLFSSDKTKSES